MSDALLYIANMTGGKQHTLQACRFDPRKARLETVWTGSEGAANSLFVRGDASGRFLFVADLVNEAEGKPGGAVASFRIDRETGKLEYINQRNAGGSVPCYLTVTRDGRFVLVANYGDGTLSVLPIRDGVLEPVCEHVEHRGDPSKQARAHCVVLDASDRFALAADLGVDRIFIYQFDAATGKLTPAATPHVQAKAGAGPRHLALHPSGEWLYCQTEYDNTVLTMTYNAGSGQAEILDVHSSLPPGYDRKTSGADVAVHPTGRWLYSTNRGHESVAMFSIDAGTGRLTPMGHVSVEGKFPRSFAIDPSGGFLLVGNEKSNAIVVFRIDPLDGKLSRVGDPFATPAPAGLCFV